MQLSFFDLHCDTAERMHSEHQEFARNDFAISLERASVFEQYVQVMAFWTRPELDDGTGWKRFLQMHRNLLADPCVLDGRAKLCTDCPPRDNGTFLLLSVEDARILESDISRVETLCQMGIRAVTPLWRGESCIGGAHDTDRGLSSFGKAAVTRMNELGILTDISHASERAADDILSIAADKHRPVIASHSNAYALCPVSRNLRNGQIQSVIQSGGLIGLNLHEPFLTTDLHATREDLLHHMEYFLERGAEHSLCFGCDMDGADLPRWHSSLSNLPALADYLLGYYSEQTVRSVFFENAYHFAKKYFSYKNP